MRSPDGGEVLLYPVELHRERREWFLSGLVTGALGAVALVLAAFACGVMP